MVPGKIELVFLEGFTKFENRAQDSDWRGDHMTNSRNITTDVTLLLDAVGGEPLTGSGFEDEQPERGFAGAELVASDPGSPRSE
jgi:hypothetical protein